jgi:hypothetical protein
MPFSTLPEDSPRRVRISETISPALDFSYSRLKLAARSFWNELVAADRDLINVPFDGINGSGEDFCEIILIAQFDSNRVFWRKGEVIRGTEN